MLYVLDTNAFSDLMREVAAVQSRLGALSDDDLVIICPIVRGEILHELLRLPHGKRGDSLQARADKLFPEIPCDPLPSCCNNFTQATTRREMLKLAGNSFGYLAFVASSAALRRDKLRYK